jgi:predicted transposase YbfD/YdcC
LETRECWTIADPAVLRALRGAKEWDQLRSVVRVRAKRVIGNTETVDDRYFLSSLEGEAEQLLAAVRSHWQIENSLHWVLDIAFREDDSRVRKDHGAQNLATLRHIALNLLKQETTAKIGVKNKRLKAGWNEEYLLRVLN